MNSPTILRATKIDVYDRASSRILGCIEADEGGWRPTSYHCKGWKDLPRRATRKAAAEAILAAWNPAPLTPAQVVLSVLESAKS